MVPKCFDFGTLRQQSCTLCLVANNQCAHVANHVGCSFYRHYRKAAENIYCDVSAVVVHNAFVRVLSILQIKWPTICREDSVRTRVGVDAITSN